MTTETLNDIKTVADLEDALSCPSDLDIAFLRRWEGDIMIVGAGGKMGPSLARLCRRAADASGRPRRVVAVSRHQIQEDGVEAIACDLLDRDQVARLPEIPNILFLAGRKFGSTDNPSLTWAANTIVPAIVAERFRNSRFVVFSTGNVYPFRAVGANGSRESDPPLPAGEYAQSCLGRERVFEHFAHRYGLPSLLFRLNYSVDLRYGVLVDIARKVHASEPVSLAVPAFNAIWQRDAVSYALRSLEYCATPPRVLNITGQETCSVRAAAEFFAARFGRPCRFDGVEGPSALLSDASASHALLGLPQVSLDRLMEMVAVWVESGGASVNKPTRFEAADGRF